MSRLFIVALVSMLAGSVAHGQAADDLVIQLELAEARRDPDLLDGVERAVATPPGGQPWPGYLSAALLFGRSEGHRALRNWAVADDLLDKALGRAEQSIRQAPDVARNHAVLADILGRKVAVEGGTAGMRYSGRISQAIRRARQLAPDDGFVLMTVGRHYLHVPEEYGGNRKEAVRNFRLAVERDPRRAVAYYWLGRALEASGVKPEAIQSYTRALEIEPAYAAARTRLQKLKDIK